MRMKNYVAMATCLLLSLRIEAQTIPSAFFHQAPSLTLIAGQPGGSGSSDGAGSSARFNYPYGVAGDSSGNLYVVDSYNYTIRKITSAGIVTTVAGLAGFSGSADATGSNARFYYPYGVVADASGNLYVADSYNHTIRKITSAGVVTTLAGSPGSAGSADGTGSAASFYYPGAVAVDSSGNVFVADTFNYTVRKITAAGVVTTLAGTAGSSGSTNGTGSAARFNALNGIAVDSAGNIYVADSGNSTIRKITSTGVVTTLAGTAGSTGSTNGTGSAARFNGPAGMAVDSAGNIYVADFSNSTIRKITSAGVVTTLAGTAGSIGSTDGTGAAARFYNPRGVGADPSGNVYVADYNNSTVRKITSAGVVTTFAGRVASSGSTNGTGAVARFANPNGIAMSGSGTMYVADSSNQTIRKITSAGVVTTLAGTAGSAGTANGTGAAARFTSPNGIAVDSTGNVYVADSSNTAIRKITSAGVVTTLAGTPGAGAGSADGTGAAAQFNYPRGLAADSSGNVYVADSQNCTIRKITSAGVVTTFAGSAAACGSADGTGTAASFMQVWGVAIDSSGTLFVTDSGNRTIRKITSSGVVTTLAGTPGVVGSADGTGAAASFNSPYGIAVDTSGNVFVADQNNSTIRKITPAGVVTTLAGVAGSAGVGLGALPGSLNAPAGLAYARGVLCTVSENSVICFPKP